MPSHARLLPPELWSLISNSSRSPSSLFQSNPICQYPTFLHIRRAGISTEGDGKQETTAQQVQTLPEESTFPSTELGPSVQQAASPTSDPSLQHTQSTSSRTPDNRADGDRSTHPRLPRSVQAVYLKPLKRKAEYGVPSCDLQLRSYSVRNVEFVADFALRAAYYLGLPAAGPVPLPRITERWTVPRSNFIFKKSQENFERITLRRLIQIQDGHPDAVEIWLAFLRKHAYYGVGMKANVWRHEKLGVGKTMEISLENLKRSMEPKWAHFGRRKTLETSERAYEMMSNKTFNQTVEGPASQS